MRGPKVVGKVPALLIQQVEILLEGLLVQVLGSRAGMPEGLRGIVPSILMLPPESSHLSPEDVTCRF
jgi:hypothetical protein